MNLKKNLPMIIILLFSFQALHAQLYKVYGYQPAEAGELEFVIWNSYIPSSDVSYNFFGSELSREGLFAHSLELEYGLSNKFGIAAYFDFEDPNDKYFITTNEKVAYPTHSRYSEPIERDCLPEGDRICHSAFIDSDGNFTYAQWYAIQDIENRLKPLEERIEFYHWTVPDKFAGQTVLLRAVLNYRRMSDSHAKYLGIPKRPTIEASRDEKVLEISK